MYRNITFNGWHYLCVLTNNRLYILGKTGKVGNCHHPGMFNSLL